MGGFIVRAVVISMGQLQEVSFSSIVVHCKCLFVCSSPCLGYPKRTMHVFLSSGLSILRLLFSIDPISSVKLPAVSPHYPDEITLHWYDHYLVEKEKLSHTTSRRPLLLPFSKSVSKHEQRIKISIPLN